MRRLRFSITDLWVVIAIVAFNCVVLDWAILDRESVVTIRGVLFMTNGVALGLYRLLATPGSRTPFFTGCVAAGAVAVLLYFDYCQLFYESALRTQKWALAPFGIDARHIDFIVIPSLGMTGKTTAQTVLISVVLTPLVVTVIGLPQLLLALAGGLLTRRLSLPRSVDTVDGASSGYQRIFTAKPFASTEPSFMGLSWNIIRRMLVVSVVILTGVGVAGYGLVLFFVAFPEYGPTDTVYSKGYSEAKFQSLRVGMTPGQVEAVVGPPLRKIPSKAAFETWWYSESPSSNDFRRRHLTFEQGRIRRIVSDFWVD